MRFTRLTLVAFVSLTFFGAVISPTVANAQSVEEAYDATLSAYNQTLNQMEECDLKFQEFQQMAKRGRPAAGASKEDWDQWATTYISWVGMYRLCISILKREADNLRKKLDELEKQINAAGSNAETKATPRKDLIDKQKKAPGLLKKGNEDLEKWTIGIRYKIGQANKMSQEASGEVEKHGSGSVKIEQSFKYDFDEPLETSTLPPKQPVADVKVETHSTDGLFTMAFIVREGRIFLHLPEYMRAGDTISGTAGVEPSGTTNEDRARNREILNRYQLKLANETLTGPWGSFTWSWLNPMPPWLKPTPNPTPGATPSSTPGAGLQGTQPFEPKGWAISGGTLMPISQDETLFVLLALPSGGNPQAPFTPVVSAPVPEDFILPPSAPRSPNKIEPPDTGQGGRENKIEGPLDGDLRTTKITIGGQPAVPLVEWPGGCVFVSPNENFGPTTIAVREKNIVVEGPYNNIGLSLRADKTFLRTGERTTVRFEFSGLESLKKRIPVQVVGQGAIDMEAGNFQTFWIQPKDVQPGGKFTTTREITARQEGNFRVIGTVVGEHGFLTIPLGENAPENGFRLRKVDGDNQDDRVKKGGGFVLNIDNVKDPLEGKKLSGDQLVEVVCLGKLPLMKMFRFKDGFAEKKDICMVVSARIIIKNEE